MRGSKRPTKSSGSKLPYEKLNEQAQSSKDAREVKNAFGPKRNETLDDGPQSSRDTHEVKKTSGPKTITARETHRIIVGVDYGTTYSGAFNLSCVH